MIRNLCGACVASYVLEDELGRGSTGVVYRARPRKGEGSVAFKLLREELSGRGEARIRFEQEVRLLSRLSHPNIVGLVDHGTWESRLFLVMELLKGTPLSRRIAGRRPLPLLDAVEVVRQTALAIAHAHEQGVLHRDVKSSNILISTSADTLDVKVLDFGLGRLRDQVAGDDGGAIGTFLYMSPEQLGVLDRPVDERSDLYSLGLLAYEALDGRHPFADLDLGALVHAHAAVTPPRPAGVPEGLWRIVLRLLRKDPGERYRSARGLAADLAEFTRRIASGDGGAFELGLSDWAADLLAPTVVGREAELALLREAWARSRSGAFASVLISGSSGAGKSRLALELQSECSAAGGLFLSGRGRAYGEASAYGLFADALEGLASRALAGSVAKEAREAVGDLAGELVRLSPGLVRVFGEQPEPPALEPERRLARFLAVMTRFLSALAKERPGLVLFLDDLQWADEGSLELLEHLSRQRKEVRLPLFLLAFRSEEIAGTRAERTLRAFEAAGAPRIHLAPLSDSAIAEMCRKTLGAELPEVAAAVAARSGGLPLFAIELLRALAASGALVRRDGLWTADPAKLAETSLGDSVLSILLRRLSTLEPEHRRLLSVAAVSGKEFEFDIVRRASGSSGDEADCAIVAALDAARAAQLVVPLGRKGRHAFSHDKVRDAFTIGLSEEEKREIHGRIGLALEATGSGAPEVVFALAYHFERSADAARAVRHAMRAGALANEQHAHAGAVAFFESALRRWDELPQESRGWERRLELLEGLGDAHDMLGHYAKATDRYTEALALAPSVREAARVRGKIGITHLRKGETAKAVEGIAAALEILGERIPKTHRAAVLVALVELARRAYWLLSPPSRVTKPDPIHHDIALLYNRCVNSLYLSDSLRMVASHLRNLNLAERTGTDQDLAQALAAHSMVAFAVPVYSRAVRFALRSIELRTAIGDVWGVANSRFYLCCVRSSEGHFLEACREGELARADFRHLGDPWEWCAVTVVLCANLVHMGQWRAAAALFDELRASSNEIDSTTTRAWVAWAMGELSSALGPERCLGEVESALAASLKEKDTWNATILLRLKGQILLRLGQVDVAVAALEQGIELVATNWIRAEWPMAIYPALAEGYLEQAAQSGDPSARKACLKKAGRSVRRALFHARLFRNHLAYSLRVKARLLWLKGARRRAVKTWQAAILFALERGQPHAHALALYDMGRALHEAQDPRGRHALLAALPIFESLGAAHDVGRVAALLGETEKTTTSTVPEGRRSLASARLASILEVGQNLAATLNHDELLERIVASAAKTLGAERGLLLLREGEASDDLRVRAVYGSPPSPVQSPERPPLAAGAAAEEIPISSSVAREVLLSGQSRIVADAQLDPQFHAAASVVRSGVRSILCSPLRFKNRVLGVLYLDNRLVRGMFSEADRTLLEALSSQAAVALENARAFRELEAAREDLSLLYHAGREVASVLLRGRVLSTLLEHAQRLAQASAGGILMGDGGTVRLKLQRGIGQDEIRRLEPLLADTPIDAPTECPLPDGGRALVLPIEMGEGPRGALLLLRVPSVDRAKALLAPLLTQACMALHNAYLYEMAITDGLTRIYQRTYFEQSLQEIARTGRPFAVLLIDLDRFKAINDTYGHPVGDEALKAVALALKATLRVTDVAARMGGDEFAVLLPDSDLAKGRLVAEKLREAISRIVLTAGTAHVTVGASLGVAASLEEPSPQRLMSLADRRLYEDKECCRNALRTE